MNNLFKKFIVVCCLLQIAGYNNAGNLGDTNALAAFNVDSLGKNIETLSGDYYLGRKPFGEGETRTLQFLLDQFRTVGLEPGNGDSYLQEVPMVKITTQAAPTMQVKAILRRDSRVVNIAFSWRFGKPLKQIKRTGSGAGDEMQRVGNG